MKNLHSTAARWLAVTVSCALALLVQSSAHATTATPFFTNLVTELQARSTALTGTTNKLAKTQKKAIDAALKSITAAHGTTVVDDLKLTSTVAKGLTKPFASEFATGGAATPPGTHAFGGLFSTLVSNLATEVTADLSDLDTQISALPEGIKKVGFAKAATAIHLLLNTALGLTPASTEATGLAAVETGIINLAKAVLKAANSGGSTGGGGATGHGFSCKINGVTYSAQVAAGVYVHQTGELAITGGSIQKSITIFAANVTAPGDYALLGVIVQDIANNVTYESNATGTIHVATFTPDTQKASGTFSFTVTQSTPTPNPANLLNVTQGTFNITKIYTSPN